MRRWWAVAALMALANVMMWVGAFFLLLCVIDYAAKAFG